MARLHVCLYGLSVDGGAVHLTSSHAPLVEGSRPSGQENTRTNSMSTCSGSSHERCCKPCRHSCCHRHNSTSCSIGGLAIYHLAWRRLISLLRHDMRWPAVWHSVWGPFSKSTCSSTLHIGCMVAEWLTASLMQWIAASRHAE